MFPIGTSCFESDRMKDLEPVKKRCGTLEAIFYRVGPVMNISEYAKNAFNIFTQTTDNVPTMCACVDIFQLFKGFVFWEMTSSRYKLLK